MTTAWLLHVDRQAWEIWRHAAEAAGTVRIEAEAGEGWRVVHLAGALPLPELVRGAIPLHLRCPSSDLGRVGELLRATGATALHAFPIRRHGRFAAQALADASRLEPPRTGTDVTAYVATSDREVFAGVTTPLAFGSPLVGAADPEPPADELSRARMKLVEALARLALQGLDAAMWRSWLELGSYPGGMTAELAHRGHVVHAVDLAEPSPAMRALPDVTFAVADVLTYDPPAAPPFDAILCDVNGPPLRAARAVARLAAARLRTGGVVVHTVKLPRWSDWPELQPRLAAVLTEAGLTTAALYHAVANRQELTWIGRR